MYKIITYIRYIKSRSPANSFVIVYEMNKKNDSKSKYL